MNNDDIYTEVPQHNFEIGFFGEGKTVEESIADLDNSFQKARKHLPALPDMECDLRFDTVSFLQFFSGRLSLISSIGCGRKVCDKFLRESLIFFIFYYFCNVKPKPN